MNDWNRKKHLNSLTLALLLVIGLLAGACQSVDGQPEPASTRPAGVSSSPSPTASQPAASPQVTATATASPTALFWLTATPAAMPTGAPDAAPSLTSTADALAPYRIENLAQRTYGGGELQSLEILAENTYFTRVLFSYLSDGLVIAGFMNLPRGDGPFPVVIALHGYIDPGIYQTLDYTTGYADALARAGFLVLHPNLRGYPPSQAGPDLFRVGMAVDVLNLIALVKAQAGRPGPLEQADPHAIGLWGHSMGGGVATRVLTVSPDVRAAVLYAAMSGNERQNYEAIQRWSEGERGLEELAVPEAELAAIAPIHFLDRISAEVSIHHGKADTLVPPAWSLDLCNQLVELDKEVSCFLYDGEPHTFVGEGETLFKQRVVDFFNRTLKP